MKKIIILLLLSATQFCYAQNDKSSITRVIQKQQADWNKNDMNAYAHAFTNEGVLINFLGMYWKGRAEIVNQFNQINDCCIKPTNILLEIINIELLNENAALVHINEKLTAKEDYAVPGKTVKKGTVDYKLITALFRKQSDGWKIASMQVTQVVPLAPK